MLVRNGGHRMDELYQNLYFHLFNRITDALAAMEQQDFGTARDILIRAQQSAEDQYLNTDG